MPEHQPYVPATQSPPELTARALILGVALGLIFSASSVYLALKIGLTVSSSIPIAVLSITIFRALGRTSILENNIVQTTGSASDSVAAGVVFTIPAILLMGYDLDIGRVAVLATVGGLMGILMMIPLRRALIVKEHDTLVYPEGTACAEVLIAGEERGLQARGLGPHGAVRISGREADPRHEPQRNPRQLRVLYRRGRRRLGGDHRARPVAADNHQLLLLEP